MGPRRMRIIIADIILFLVSIVRIIEILLFFVNRIDYSITYARTQWH